MINYEKLERNAENLAEQFQKAAPQRHVVLDNFLLPDIALEASSKFPRLSEMDQLRDFRQDKAQDPAIAKFNPIFGNIIFEHLHSPRFVKFMSQLTGIQTLHADPHLYAAGLAQGGDKSFLNVHIDNSSHPVQPWYRRVNILVYLNPNWTEEKGGHVEFYSDDMKRSTAILPIFNRAVIFATHKKSWHGYRTVNTPDGDSRKSINIYYFSEESPTGDKYYHITSFKAREHEVQNKLLYPLDNAVRTIARWVRPNKDSHAVFYPANKTPHKPTKSE